MLPVLIPTVAQADDLGQSFQARCHSSSKAVFGVWGAGVGAR
jgi:hypothetical protein